MQATDSFSPAAQLRVIYGLSAALAPEQIMSITTSDYMYNDVNFEFVVRPRGISSSGDYDLYSYNEAERVSVKGYDLRQRGYRAVISGKLMSEILVLQRI